MNAEEYLKSPEAQEASRLFHQAILLQRQALEKLQAERQKILGLLDAVDSQIRALKFDMKTEHRVYAKVTDEMLIEFLEEDQTTADVIDEFGFSSATVAKRLNALLKAKKVTMRREGTSKIWKAAA